VRCENSAKYRQLRDCARSGSNPENELSDLRSHFGVRFLARRTAAVGVCIGHKATRGSDCFAVAFLNGRAHSQSSGTVSAG
jgi:hypothetical protein